MNRLSQISVREHLSRARLIAEELIAHLDTIEQELEDENVLDLEDEEKIIKEA